MALKIEKLQRLDLGIQGEHNATLIRIDCNGWKAQYPNGVISLFHQRKGDEIPGVTGASYDSETGILTWSVTDQDTYYDGEGMATIQLTEGTVIRKKKKALTIVRPTLVNDVGDGLESNWQAYLNEMTRIRGTLASQSEAWATGNRNGEPVTDPEDEVYHNNSKYYHDTLAEHAQEYIDEINEAGRIMADLIPDDLSLYATGETLDQRLAPIEGRFDDGKLKVANGGTAGNTAGSARENLGLTTQNITSLFEVDLSELTGASYSLFYCYKYGNVIQGSIRIQLGESHSSKIAKVYIEPKEDGLMPLNTTWNIVSAIPISSGVEIARAQCTKYNKTPGDGGCLLLDVRFNTNQTAGKAYGIGFMYLTNG